SAATGVATGIWATGIWATGIWATGIWATGIWATGIWATDGVAGRSVIWVFADGIVAGGDKKGSASNTRPDSADPSAAGRSTVKVAWLTGFA
ncbi:MAG: hypothetical protein ACYSWU_19150, partial [Planctomycetota bacterium]